MDVGFISYSTRTVSLRKEHEESFFLKKELEKYACQLLKIHLILNHADCFKKC